MRTYRDGMFKVGLALAQGDITPDTPDREVAQRYKGESTKHRYLQQLQADGHGLHIRWVPHFIQAFIHVAPLVQNQEKVCQPFLDTAVVARQPRTQWSDH